MSDRPVYREWRWQHDAKCSKDPEVQLELRLGFDRFTEYHNAKEAKKYCLDCPVMGECHEEAMRLLELGDWYQRPYGIWGGLDEKDRRKILRSKRQLLAKILAFEERWKAQSQDTSDPNVA